MTGLLEGPRARGAFLLRCLLDPPWSLRIEDRAPLTLLAMVRGSGWYVPAEGEPLQVRAGEVAIVRGPDAYVFADDRSSKPQIVIHPDERCTTIDGRNLSQEMGLGVRTWGSSSDAETMFLTGTYSMDGEVSDRVLHALPRALVVATRADEARIVDLLAAELTREDPGQEVILDRLLDLLLVSILRTWLSSPGAQAPGWFYAHGDPVVGPALRMLYNEPSEHWTIARLAGEVGVSRSALAMRFNDLVGQPPMTFLTGWRMSLAADLLRQPEMTVKAVASSVGYGSPYAFSNAFKREYGVSPTRYREQRSGKDR